MKTEQEIRQMIVEFEERAKYWYKLNKDPNRPLKRGYCVFQRNKCLSKIKLLKQVLEDEDDSKNN